MEDISDENPIQEETTTILRVDPMTRGPEQEENYETKIQTARIIVTRLNGNVVANRLFPLIGDTVRVPGGYLNVYLIANERSDWNLNSYTTTPLTQLTAADLKQKVYPFSDPVVKADSIIPMFGKFENVLVDQYGNMSQNGTPISMIDTVERIFSKVTLDLSCLYSDLANGGAPIEVKSISVQHAPTKSYLDAKRYTESAFFNCVTAFSAGNYTPMPVANPTGFRDTSVFYIPEYLVNDTSLYCYLSIKVNLVSDPASEREYKIILGEGQKTHGNAFMNRSDTTRNVTDLSIFRNTHFRIAAKIKSFDITGEEDIDVKLKVIDWGDGDADDWEDGEYYFTVSQNAFNVSSIPYPYYGVIEIATDHPGGWSASRISGTNIDPINLTGQPSGKLNFTVTGTGTAVIAITVGSITKQVKITAS
jgi:hypothetical protein